MQRVFEEELEKLRNRIIRMGSLVEDQINKAIDALLSGNTEIINQVIENENIIDKIDVKIDKLCERIFALKQPVASDLRFIMAALKIDNDLERIGDIAYEISKTLAKVPNSALIVRQFKIDELSGKITKIVKKAIDTFINRDIKLSEEVLEEGFFITEQSQKLFNDILIEMINKPEVIVDATHLILLLRHFERIADHSRNIAESVVFMVEGKIVKHSKLQETTKGNEENSNIQ